MENKVCSKCKTEKPLSDFYKNKGGKFGYHHYCKLCHNENSKNYYLNSKERRNLIKAKLYMRRYGLTINDVDNLFKSQNGQCAICYKKIENKRHIYIDHNHLNNQVRGILCPSCNTIIGLARDNIEILGSAIKYVRKNF